MYAHQAAMASGCLVAYLYEFFGLPQCVMIVPTALPLFFHSMSVCVCVCVNLLSTPMRHPPLYTPMCFSELFFPPIPPLCFWTLTVFNYHPQGCLASGHQGINVSSTLMCMCVCLQCEKTSEVQEYH